MEATHLSEFLDTACRAFYNSSFSPEKRGANFIKEYETILNEDLKHIPTGEQEQYITKFKAYISTILARQSRIASPMVTGAGDFSIERNRRAVETYLKYCDEFSQWRINAKKAIERKAEAAKPIEQKAAEEWEAIKLEIDTVYITQLLYGKLERIAIKGKVELMQKAIDYVRELNAKRPKPIFTERHKFFKLVSLAEHYRDKLGQREAKEPLELCFENGKLIKNYREDRLQIIFNGKPSLYKISDLKQNGFKWSPKSGAWQRQLTDNALYAVTRVTPVTLEQLRNWK